MTPRKVLVVTFVDLVRDGGRPGQRSVGSGAGSARARTPRWPRLSGVHPTRSRRAERPDLLTP